MSKDITLVIVDNKSYDLAKFSIDQTLQAIDCKNILTFSNKPIFDGATFVPISETISLYDYSEIILKQLSNYIETDYVLVIQWDGMAVNPNMWDDNFLKFDYIGAIWPWPIKGEQIGNGGFSFRSRRLIEACQDNEIKLGGYSDQNEDIAICVEYKKMLESKYGINFANLDIARKFSTENEWISPTFGFHGIWNTPRFLNEKQLDFVINHLPEYFWNDASKVQSLINVLVEEEYDNLAVEVYNKGSQYV